MESQGLKADLHRYLQAGREALLWKLDGLSEYDCRRPMTPTGTNVLGLVKHVASVEAGYLGDVFGRPFGEPLPWFDEGAEPNADMWATSEESREHIENIDGSAGLRPDNDNLAEGDAAWWAEYRNRLETVARVAR
jgi:hypothetical protein